MCRLGRLTILNCQVPSQNEWDRSHFRKRHKAKGEWRLLLVACRNSRDGNPVGLWEPGETWTPAVKGEKRTLRVVHFRKRLCDSDNLTAASKSLIVDNVKGRPLWLLWDDDVPHASIQILQHPVTVSLPMIRVDVFSPEES